MPWLTVAVRWGRTFSEPSRPETRTGMPGMRKKAESCPKPGSSLRQIAIVSNLVLWCCWFCARRALKLLDRIPWPSQTQKMCGTKVLSDAVNKYCVPTHKGSVYVHFINKDEPSLERAWPHLLGAQLHRFSQTFSACKTEGPQLNFPMTAYRRTRILNHSPGRLCTSSSCGS